MSCLLNFQHSIPEFLWQSKLLLQNTQAQKHSVNDHQSVLPKSASGKIRKPTAIDHTDDDLMDCWSSCDVATTTQTVETEETTMALADTEITYETVIIESQSESGTELYDNVVETTPPAAEESATATEKTVVEMPLELKLVSLLHQHSLVIAEIKWVEEGMFPGKQYLVTWELTGGGLKGHLVTDTNSVTLSLWPSTSYKVQVEPFTLNLDSDGEQPMPTTSEESSAPLVVDTSIASFSLEHPYALLVSEYTLSDEEEYHGEQEEQHESIQDSHDQGYQSDNVIFISMLSIVFMAVLIILSAFSWPRIRAGAAAQLTEKDVTLLIPGKGESLEKEFTSVSVISFTDSCRDIEKCRHCVQIA